MFNRTPEHLLDVSIGKNKANTKNFIFCVISGNNGCYIDELKSILPWEDYYYVTVKGAKHRNGAKEILWRKHLHRVNERAYQLDLIGNVVKNKFFYG